MKEFLLFLLFYFVISQFKIQFADGMDRGKGKQLMKGSASELQGMVQGFQTTFVGNKEFPSFFSLTELYSLIVILESITIEILEQYEQSSLEQIIDFYCRGVACDKIKMVNAQFNRVRTMRQWTLCQWAIVQYLYKVIGVYNDFLCPTEKSNKKRNYRITFGLFVFARKFIRSFFEFHNENKYYDNLVERFNPGMNVSVSLLKYMKAYDLFEAKANEWILIMGKKKIYRKNEEVSLETTENANYLPTSMVSEENENIDKENVDFKIYQYVVINEEITAEDCKKFNDVCFDKREKKNIFNTFYSYFNELAENVQLKLEHKIINPFLTEKIYEGYRNRMFDFYKTFVEDQIKYNQYLPQSRIQITIQIRDYCRDPIGPKLQPNQIAGHGHRGGHSGGHHSRNQGGRGGGHHYASGDQSGYVEGQNYNQGYHDGHIGGHHYASGHQGGYGEGGNYGSGYGSGYGGYQGNY